MDYFPIYIKINHCAIACTRKEGHAGPRIQDAIFRIDPGLLAPPENRWSAAAERIA
ncbi:MAG: hypothetical protein R3C97_09945 [Geminicoccaceae bacterium]